MMDEEQCPNCYEMVDSIELMMHGGYCKVCFDDGVDDPEDEDE